MMLVLCLILVLKEQFIVHINGQVKEINIKNRGYYFCDDMINIKNFDSSLLKIDKKSHDDIDIYDIGYTTINTFSDCENIHSVNLCI